MSVFTREESKAEARLCVEIVADRGAAAFHEGVLRDLAPKGDIGAAWLLGWDFAQALALAEGRS